MLTAGRLGYKGLFPSPAPSTPHRFLLCSGFAETCCVPAPPPPALSLVEIPKGRLFVRFLGCFPGPLSEEEGVGVGEKEEAKS